MYPDFLGIGAQRAGTTWLAANLRRHPGIWMPPIKELHHFDDPSSRRLITCLFANKRHGRKALLRTALRWERRRLKQMSAKRLSWWLRYFFLALSDDWYSGLFSTGSGQIAGEVTPEYARLEAGVVDKIHGLMPRARIIYLLRNPIERAWSQAAMHFSMGDRPGLHTIADGEIKAFLERESVFRNSDYVKNLQVWERVYTPRQIFVGFYEQLVQD